jgi:hypothetical protein
MRSMNRKPGGIRDRVIGQYRHEKKRAWESPDQQDRVPYGRSEKLVPTLRHRAGLGSIEACAHCGRTRDLWEENNGEGLTHKGRRYCCKPCSQGKDCICQDMESHKGSELGSLTRYAIRRKH